MYFFNFKNYVDYGVLNGFNKGGSVSKKSLIILEI